MKTKKPGYTVPLLMQKAFVMLGLLTYLVAAGTNIFMLTAAYGSRPVRVSPFLVGVLESVLLPVILFCLAYFTSRSTMPKLWRSFESLVLIAAASLLEMIAGTILMFVPIPAGDLSLAALYQIIPGVVVLLSFSVMLLWHRRVLVKKAPLSPEIQRLFVALSLTAFIANTAMILASIWQQLPHNPNLSGFYVSMAETIGLPILLFAGTYFCLPKTLRPLNRLFESALAGLMGLMLYGILSQTGYLATWSILSAWSERTGWYWPVETIALVLTIAIYIAGLSRQRPTRP